MTEAALHTGDVAPVAPTRGATMSWRMRWQVPVFVLSLVAWGIYVAVAHREDVRAVEDPRDAVNAIAAAFRARQYAKVVDDARLFTEVYRGHESTGEVQLQAGQASFELARRSPEDAAAHYSAAVELLRNALKWDVDDDSRWQALTTLAACYEGLGLPKNVIETADEIVKRFGEKGIKCQLARARAEFALGRIDDAEATVERFLARTTVEPDERVDALMVLAEGYLSAGRLDPAAKAYREVLTNYTISQRAPEAHFGLGMVLLAKGKSDAGAFAEAADHFEKARSGRVSHEEMQRKAAFYLGVALLEGGKRDDAIEQFHNTGVLYGGTPEGVAAELRYAALMVDDRKYGAAREALVRVLGQVPKNGRLASPYISAEMINAVWREVLGHYRDEGQYASAEELNLETEKVGGRTLYLYQQATLYRHHAKELDGEAAALRRQGLFGEADAKAAEARKQYVAAGRLLTQVASSVSGDKELLNRAAREAADALFAGGDYAGAIVFYHQVMTSRDEKDTQGMRMRFAQALQALGRHAEAVKAFDDCVRDFGKQPAGAEAALGKADSCIALGDLEGAEKALEGILSGEVLKPEAAMWERALVKLAYVVYCRGKYAEAVRRFDEILTREIDLGPTRFTRSEAVYYLADSWRNVRSAAPEARQRELTEAAGWYAKVREGVENETGLPEVMRQVVRRSVVAQAECLYELEEYAGALAVYEVAAERYLDSTEGVGALYGMAASLRRLGRTDEAMKAAARARWSLAQFKKAKPDVDTAFLEGTWNAMISWHVASGDE